MNIFSSRANSAGSKEENQQKTVVHQEFAKNGEIEADPGKNSESPAQNKENFGGIWVFQNILNSLSSKSEGIIKTYRRDLEEFGVGLVKETEALRDLAANAVKSVHGEENISAQEGEARVANLNSQEPDLKVSNPNTGETRVRVLDPDSEDSRVRVSGAKNWGEPKAGVSKVFGSGHVKGDDEDEVGWDEIEEESNGGGSEKKEGVESSRKGGGSRVDIRKIMSAAADDDEDLKWDVDEDVDDVKSSGAR